MKNLIILTIGALIGFFLSVTIYFYYSFKQISEPPKARVEFTKKLIEEDQAKLGTTCVAASKSVTKYVESISPYVESLRRNERIDPSNPVLSEGHRLVEIFMTCHNINMMAETNKLELPSPPIFDDGQLQDSIAVIHLALNQAAAEWCETKCIADTLQKITTFMKRAKDRLAQHHA